MTLSTRTLNDLQDIVSCSENHSFITFHKKLDCPLCRALELKEYYMKNSYDLKNKYEKLYATALEFSPEILL